MAKIEQYRFSGLNYLQCAGAPLPLDAASRNRAHESLRIIIQQLNRRWPPCSARSTPADSSPWRNPDPKVDALQAAVLEVVTAGECDGRSRAEIFDAVWRLAGLGSRHDWPDLAALI